MSLIFDGERYVPEIGGVIHAEHLHRYRLARILAKGKDVLDVACGEGYGSDLLAEVAHSVSGVDISADAVDNARQTYSRANLCFIQGSCTGLPCDDASFDMVVSFETIEHHDQHELMVAELRRVLRPGGVMLISTPNRPEYNRTLNEPNPFHVKELDFDEFAALLRSHFQNVIYYAQRVLNASCIMPIDNGAVDFYHFDTSGGGTSGIPRPVYFLAVAGDGPLPDLGASVYEVSPMCMQSQESMVAEARLYVSEIVDGVAQPYTESRRTAAIYPVSGRRKTLRLSMPMDLKPIARIRIDPANCPIAVWIHSLSFERDDGSTIWRWNGDAKMFVNVGGLSIRPEQDGLLLLSLNDDPQFDLAVSSEVLASLEANVCIVIELTPRHLTEVVTELISKNDLLIADLRAGLSKKGAFNSSSLSTVMDTSTLRLVSDIEHVAALLKNILAKRNQTIAQQAKQLKMMREELLRAEAQLNLLKDIMLEDRM